jgi:hypothetical protein
MDINIVDDLLETYEWTPSISDPENGKIYMIGNTNTDVVYIGSTCKSLNDIFMQHLSQYRSWLQWKKTGKQKYKGMISYKVFKDGFSKITLIEDFPCDSVHALRKREGEVIKATPTAINKSIPCRNYKKWKADRDQEEIDSFHKNSIQKPEGFEQNSIQDIMKDLQSMSTF